jgi:hypothetical protein
VGAGPQMTRTTELVASDQTGLVFRIHEVTESAGQ